ncbi:TonB-dependent receptor [Haemophilus haemoglobinophilus]|nr:TonB-dependent receptor [Canicola haemoglobinophilus]
MKKNLITTALLATLAASVHAESTKNQLQPITVYSAYATPINQDKTASSVTVLTEKDFAERNATYVSDVLKTVPGVAMGANGGRGTLTSLFLRGANSNQTAIIIDGVKMKPVNSLGFDFGGLSLSNIERIEVLRGEQSALWGSDAMGGVIYITTKSGLYKDKPFNIDFDFGTGSHRTLDGSVTVSGYSNGFYYSLNGNSHRTKGISALSSDKFNYTSTTGTSFSMGGAVEKDKFHRDNASLRLGYDDNQKGIEILASHSSQTAHFDEAYDRNETFYDDRARSRETLFKLSGYVGNEQELFKHKIEISQLKTDSDTFTTSNIYDPITYVKTATVPSHPAYDAKKQTGNYQLDINFDREGVVTQSISLLAEYQRASYISDTYTDKKKLAEKSIAAEYRLFSEEDHSLSLSGRFTDNSQHKNAWTGRISVAYRISPNLKAHASLGSAIQNPTIIDYYGYYGSYKGNPNLKPAKSLGGDLGLLLETTDKQHSLDVTYFARNVKNFLQDTYSPVTQTINLNGTTKVKGVELAYQGKFTTALSAYLNYTFTQTKDSKGLELARRPKHMGNLGVAYQITDKLGADANLSYVGKRIDTFPHRTKMPSYTLVNLGANYQLTKNLNMYAHLNNVFDKKYENVLGYGQDGRNVYLGLKGSF